MANKTKNEYYDLYDYDCFLAYTSSRNNFESNVEKLALIKVEKEEVLKRSNDYDRRKNS